MDNRTRLIHDLRAARQEMRAAASQIDRDREIYPGWTIKHVLAHIAGWDDAIIASLRAHAGGEEPGTPATEGINFYNAQSVATRQELDYEHIAREWEVSRNELEEVLREMPAARFEETLLFPWGETGTIAYLVHIFEHHEREHAQEIRELLAGPAAG
jgi:hypothetical protein